MIIDSSKIRDAITILTDIADATNVVGRHADRSMEVLSMVRNVPKKFIDAAHEGIEIAKRAYSRASMAEDAVRQAQNAITDTMTEEEMLEYLDIATNATKLAIDALKDAAIVEHLIELFAEQMKQR